MGGNTSLSPCGHRYFLKKEEKKLAAEELIDTCPGKALAAWKNM
jgi:hypothetical protein